MAMNLMVVLQFLWERLQAILSVISSYWTKDMLFWEKGSVFVLTGKEKRLWISSRVIWIRLDRGRPSEVIASGESNKKYSLCHPLHDTIEDLQLEQNFILTSLNTLHRLIQSVEIC